MCCTVAVVGGFTGGELSLVRAVAAVVNAQRSGMTGGVTLSVSG